MLNMDKAEVLKFLKILGEKGTSAVYQSKALQIWLNYRVTNVTDVGRKMFLFQVSYLVFQTFWPHWFFLLIFLVCFCGKEYY